MKYLTLLFLILFSSCVIDDPESPNKNCSSILYWHRGDKKEDLSKKLINNGFYISFNDNDKTSDDVSLVLSNLGIIFSYKKVSNSSGSSEGYIYEFKDGLNCADLNELRLKIRKQENVNHVSFFYLKTNTIKENIIRNIAEADVYTYEGYFFVKLKKLDDVELLNKMLERTKTTLFKNVDSEFYLIKTDVNSLGDALEMANYFHESNQFKYVHPVFSGFDL